MSLSGRLLVVIARMPDPVDALVEPTNTRMTSDWIETEEALSSVVRAIVEAGGRVALFGDRTSTLLALIVTAEYLEPQEAEGRERPPARLIVADAGVEEERAYALGGGLGIAEISSANLRDLAQRADALICIGSTNLLEEIRIFRNANDSAPIFAFARTGGGAQALTHSVMPGNVSFPDLEAEKYRPRRRARADRPSADEERNPEFEYPAFALAAQIIVERLKER
jgi:hypothetical protein